MHSNARILFITKTNYENTLPRQIPPFASSSALELRNTRAFQQLQTQHYKDLYHKYQEISSIRHDLTAVLKYLDQISEPTYIERIKQALDDAQVLTGTQELDVVLLSLRKDVIAQGLNILFDINIKGGLDWITPLHFFIFMKNALSNASQSVLSLPKHSQEALHLKMVGGNARLSLRIKNKTIYCYSKTRNQTIRKTIAESGHGIGMKNMMEIINLYDGYMEYETLNGYFNLSVLLQNTTKEV